VAQIPDRQDLVSVQRRDDGFQSGEVVDPPFVDHGPWNAFPGNRNADGAQKGVILIDVLVVLRLGRQIAPPLVFPDEGGALEP
jgi:hypothetical protein